MKCTGLFPIVFSFGFIILSCSISLAQTDLPCGQTWNTPLSEVTGEVMGSYFAVPPWTNVEGLHLETKTSSGAIIIIHVFPTECVEKNPPEKFQFTTGTVVTVTGSEFLTEAGTQRNICAADIAQRPDLKLRTLQTGCLNDELCSNCQGICEETCSSSPNFDLCITNCLASCEANITPCSDIRSGAIIPTNFLLLNNL